MGIIKKMSRISYPHKLLRGLNPVTLRFKDTGFERRYQSDYAGRSLFVARVAMFFGGVQYLLFTVLDILLASLFTKSQFYELLSIRVAVFTFILGIIAWSYRRSFRKYMQAAISLVPLVAGAGVALMIMTIETEGGYNQYYVGFIMIFIYIHVLLRLRFVTATAVSWTVFLFYVYASLNIDAASEYFINSSFFLISVQICGMVASYLLEYYDRTVFRQKINLDSSRRELKREHDRKEKELIEMRNIQIALLPNSPPEHPEFDIATGLRTASEVGGDYFDFHVSDSGAVTFAIGDATGHGAQAGVLVTAVKILFLKHADCDSLTETVTKISTLLKRINLKKLYMSFALGRLSEDKLELVGAGMPDAVHWCAETGQFQRISLKGMPLGSNLAYPYRLTTITLKIDDLIFFMSDGLPELFNSDGQMLGYDLPAKMMENYIHLSPAEIITEFGRKIRNFSAGEPLRDDITMIVIKKKISMGQKVTGMQSIIDCDPVYEQDGSEISHRGETI